MAMGATPARGPAAIGCLPPAPLAPRGDVVYNRGPDKER